MSIVRQGQPPVGAHLIVNLYDIHNNDLLRYVWVGRQALIYVIDELHLHVVNDAAYQFEPCGYTIAFVLSESHLSIHTYPEYNSAYLDIFCCNPAFNPNQAIRVLKDAFQTETATFQIVRR